ncbi:MAG: hypothetical protein JWP60_5019, partial [Ramlibacter sp.]|nr:hypothetical protein [Ramlibacter sp.]
MPPSNEDGAAPPTHWGVWLRALWAGQATLAWQASGDAARAILAGRAPEQSALHLPA